jgi:hypothetical protein
MLGWTILFALMTVPGATAALTGYPAWTPLKSTSVVFAVLFLAALTTRALRTRSR